MCHFLEITLNWAFANDFYSVLGDPIKIDPFQCECAYDRKKWV